MRTSHFAAVISLLLSIAEPSPVAAQDAVSSNLSVEPRVDYARAIQSFRAQRFSDAYGRFAQLADAGHVPSAQLALMMYRNGSTLFDSNWSAAPSQQQRWNALVTSSVCDNFASDQRSD